MTVRLVARRSLEDTDFAVSTVYEPLVLPLQAAASHHRWVIRAPEYTVVVAIELHLLADVATASGQPIAQMYRVSLMPEGRPPQSPLKSKKMGAFFEFQAGDLLHGDVEIPAQAARGEVRVRFIGNVPKLTVETLDV